MPAVACAVLAGLFVAGPPWPAAGDDASSDELVGLWTAKRRFGPDARGPLVIERTLHGWTADFCGRVVPVRVEADELAFDLDDGAGSFRGSLRAHERVIAAHWISPNSRIHGSRYASPVVLRADGRDRWRGEVVPRDDTFTLYLMAQKRADGSVGAFLRNPERNIGVRYDVDRIVRAGDAVQLVGKRGGRDPEGVLLSGTYDAENGILALAFPERGGTYDFRRDPDGVGFFPRGKNPPRYAYRRPLERADGWPTAHVDDADIDRAGLERFIQSIIDAPVESIHSPMIEGVLIARHGKLVLEEYFHDQHRDKLHETRSASKSMVAIVVGAALEAGVPLALSTPVYQVMNGGSFPVDLDAQKRTMTLENLLTMASGYYCDDTDPNAPGNEERLLEQADEPDYYRYTLALPMASTPGEKSVYCSVNPDLALAVVARATGTSALDAFQRLVADPLGITTYAWPLDPAGNAYGGGGAQFLPRDFMKLGQLMLDGGAWRGRRILGRDFAARASASLYHMRNLTYGYYWWGIDYPYKDRTVHAFFAGGNGGQSVMVIPDLDLVVAFYAANYGDKPTIHISHNLVPRHILPCVRERGDDRSAPVVTREFTTPYGRSENAGPVAKTSE